MELHRMTLPELQKLQKELELEVDNNPKAVALDALLQEVEIEIEVRSSDLAWELDIAQ